MTTAFEQHINAEANAKMVRDPEAVNRNLFMVGEGVNARYVTREPCYILIPKRWAYNGMAIVDDKIYITCIFPIVYPGQGVYGIVNQVNKIMIQPDVVSIIKIQDDEYFKFSFEKDSTVWPLLLLNVEDTLAYPIFDEIIARGNAPVYLLYDDGCKILKSANITAGINLSPNNIIIEMTYAVISRDLVKRKEYYRHTVTSAEYQLTQPPAIVGLRNVSLGATNFVTRVAGSYADTGVESSLVNPSVHREGVENILVI